MSRKPHFYIYKTTNLINNKFYIGMHYTSDLNDGYLGSGIHLRRSIRKYGKENFIKEILEFCIDKESLAKREAEIVNSDLIKEELCMNLKLGGFGGLYNEEHRKKFYEAGRKKQKWLWENDLVWRLNRSKQNSETFLGKSHTEETKLKISLSSKGLQVGNKNGSFDTCWIYNIDLKQNKKIQKSELENYLNQNWFKGRKIKF